MNLRATAALAIAIVLSPSATVADETTTILMRNLRVVETTNLLAEQLKDVLTPEIGFPQEYTEHWNAAVDAAFAPELIEVDFIEALDRLLSAETRAAGLAFDESDLGRKIYDLEMDAQPFKEDPAYLEKARKRLQTGSVEENGLFVDLFESLDGASRANAIMDFYFRAMVTAASPVIGAEAAEQWVGTVQELRAGYVDEYFLTTVAVYGQLPDDQLRVLVRDLAIREMSDYTDHATRAFAEVLAAAAVRLNEAYSVRVGGS